MNNNFLTSLDMYCGDTNVPQRFSYINMENILSFNTYFASMLYLQLNSTKKALEKNARTKVINGLIWMEIYRGDRPRKLVQEHSYAAAPFLLKLPKSYRQFAFCMLKLNG